jgi:hypothetical protein
VGGLVIPAFMVLISNVECCYVLDKGKYVSKVLKVQLCDYHWQPNSYYWQVISLFNETALVVLPVMYSVVWHRGYCI